jgi:sporulation protein YlmC with PRC-barrel domain
MRVSQVRGLPVLDSTRARQAGVVADLVIDVTAARVVALDVHHGDGLLVHRVTMDSVERVGSRSVLVPRSSELELAQPREWADHLMVTDALIGLEVLSEAGERVGYVSDVHFGPKTKSIHSYEVTTSAWEPWCRRTRLHPAEVLACSPDAMLVTPDAYRPTFRPVERLQHALGFIRKA